MNTNLADTRKVAIVTGASSGIGKSTAYRFLEAGYTVYAGARRIEAMRDLESKGVNVRYLDLKNLESIHDFVQEILDRNGRVDVLVNNAGFGLHGSVEEVPIIQARDHMEVNLFGPALLIQKILPTMRKQRFGRIINVSSIGGKIVTPLGAWYHASKFALEGFSDCLRIEVRPFGIDVIVIEPGGVKTGFFDSFVSNFTRISGNGPYKPIVDAFANLFNEYTMKKLTDPNVIANLIVQAAITQRPKIRYVAPFHARVILLIRWLLPDRAYDWILGRCLKLPKRL